MDDPFTLSYDELMGMPQIEADVTLSCVSNEVGGDLVGNARWQGVPLRALLERAGVRQGATPGRHRIAARATDELQTDVRTPVAPDGASGHPSIVVEVIDG
ncbi:molybdopterin-dependent oxidoreductase [Modestobacter sp. SYSU DS0290]